MRGRPALLRGASREPVVARPPSCRVSPRSLPVAVREGRPVPPSPLAACQRLAGPPRAGLSVCEVSPFGPKGQPCRDSSPALRTFRGASAGIDEGLPRQLSRIFPCALPETAHQLARPANGYSASPLAPRAVSPTLRDHGACSVVHAGLLPAPSGRVAPSLLDLAARRQGPSRSPSGLLEAGRHRSGTMTPVVVVHVGLFPGPSGRVAPSPREHGTLRQGQSRPPYWLLGSARHRSGTMGARRRGPCWPPSGLLGAGRHR
jgi:hypothetical protein